MHIHCPLIQGSAYILHSDPRQCIYTTLRSKALHIYYTLIHDVSNFVLFNGRCQWRSTNITLIHDVSNFVLFNGWCQWRSTNITLIHDVSYFVLFNGRCQWRSTDRHKYCRFYKCIHLPIVIASLCKNRNFENPCFLTELDYNLCCHHLSYPKTTRIYTYHFYYCGLKVHQIINTFGVGKFCYICGVEYACLENRSSAAGNKRTCAFFFVFCQKIVPESILIN